MSAPAVSVVVLNRDRIRSLARTLLALAPYLSLRLPAKKIAAIIALGAGAFYYGKTRFEAPGPVARDGAPETVILLPMGMSVKSIAAKLEAEGVGGTQARE